MIVSRCAAVLVAIGLMATPVPAIADDETPVVLQPLSKWQLDMGEHNCRLARAFGPKNAPTLFYLEQWNPSREAEFLIAGPMVESFSKHRKTTIHFGPGGEQLEIEILPSTMEGFGKVIRASSSVTLRDYDPNELGRYQDRDWAEDPRGLQELNAAGGDSVTRLTISQKRRASLVLELGQMAAGLEAMNRCMADLVTHWGFDLEEQRRVISPPKTTNIMQVARAVQREYPDSALRKGAQADFHLRMTVGADGEIEDCVMLNQTLADDFDYERHPCKAFETFAKVEPARDADGNAVRSFMIQRIKYRMGL